MSQGPCFDGARLRELRIKAGLSQEGLERKSGIRREQNELILPAELSR